LTKADISRLKAAEVEFVRHVEGIPKRKNKKQQKRKRIIDKHLGRQCNK
jgi:hypothetical protein